MDRRSFIQISFSTVLTSSILTCTKSVETRPNIIYINVDDLGWTDLAFQSSVYYETPHIDKLASEGMVFTNAYAPAANCAPSRACCMTGQYTPRHGIYTVGNSDRGDSKDRKLIPIENTLEIKEDNLTIAHYLKSAGYRTASIGKWHISSDPEKNGFDVNIAGSHTGMPSPSHGGYHSPYNYPHCIREEEGEYLTDRLSDEAVQFIQRNQNQPFFLYLPFYTVHVPIQPKEAYEVYFHQKQSSEAHHDAAYAAMIKSLDEGVGKIIKTLKDLNLEENTFVLFTSDNGAVWKTSKQWPLRAGKGSYYEGGIRVPMIVRWSGKVKTGSICDVPVNGIDFLPTLLDVVNQKRPKEKVLDGLSLMPLLTQKGTIQDRPLFWHFPIYLQAYVKEGPVETRDPKFRTRPGSVVRFGNWKLHEYFEDNGLELYNLKDDIGEKRNLIDDYPEKAKELHDLLIQWREEIYAPVASKINPDFLYESYILKKRCL